MGIPPLTRKPPPPPDPVPRHWREEHNANLVEWTFGSSVILGAGFTLGAIMMWIIILFGGYGVINLLGLEIDLATLAYKLL